jgi:hypothetical protein
MALPFLLMAGGTAMQIAGQWSANMEQAMQERVNARYHRMEAAYAQEAQQRAEDLASYSYSNRVGSQISAYASGNVEISGSASLTVGATVGMALNELHAIKEKGKMDTMLAQLRAGQADRNASTLGSFGYNFMQGAGTLIGNYAKTDGFGKGAGFLKFMDGEPTPDALYGSGSSFTGAGASASTVSFNGGYESQYFGHIGGK